MKPTQPLLPFDPRPRKIATDTLEELSALLSRTDLVVESAQRGEGNGQWACRVRWVDPPKPASDRELGRRAFANGRSQSENPFDRASQAERWAEWDGGWRDEQRYMFGV